MRNYIMFITALILIFVGCAQNEIVEDRSGKNEIAFRSLNNKVTRAANDNKDDYAVYIEYIDDDTNERFWIMENQLVDGKNDSYSPVKYWPNNKQVNIYAFAPYNGNYTFPGYPFLLNHEYTVPQGADEDFTFVDIGFTSTPSHPSVSGPRLLRFRHRLAKVSVNVKLSDELLEQGFLLDLERTSVDLNVASNSGRLWRSQFPLDPYDSPATYNKLLNPVPEFLIIPQPTWVATAAPHIGDSKVSFQLKDIKIIKDNEKYWEGDLKKYHLTGGEIINAEIHSENFDNWFLQGCHYNIEFILSVNTMSEDDFLMFCKVDFNSTVSDWDEYPSSFSDLYE